MYICRKYLNMPFDQKFSKNAIESELAGLKFNF